MNDRDRLRQLVRTYGLKRIGTELGWENDYVLSVLDGMNACTAFWASFARLVERMSPKVGAR